MCVIAVSKKGIRQPTITQLRTCFQHNPHGAGYMYARNGQVQIHKGFMTWEDFARAVKAERFTADDVVVYHFRISTQAGVNPEMTHPFPLASDLDLMEALDVSCKIGVAHNGIIRMTSGYSNQYSDTALFVADYMTKLIRSADDVTDPFVNEMIQNLTNSKWALLDGATENVVTVGHFINDNGLLFSNGTYMSYFTNCKA